MQENQDFKQENISTNKTIIIYFMVYVWSKLALKYELK